MTAQLKLEINHSENCIRLWNKMVFWIRHCIYPNLSFLPVDYVVRWSFLLLDCPLHWMIFEVIFSFDLLWNVINLCFWDQRVDTLPLWFPLSQSLLSPSFFSIFSWTSSTLWLSGLCFSNREKKRLVWKKKELSRLDHLNWIGMSCFKPL